MSYKRFAPLEIPEETDLAARQLRSPILADVPAWLIRHICSEDYFRNPKRPPKVKGYYQNLSQAPSHGMSGYWSGGHFFEYGTGPSAELKPATGYARHGVGAWASENVQSANKARDKRLRRQALKGKLEKGNLPNEDYRFWEGSRTGDVVHCRFCGFRAPSLEARHKHFRESGLMCSHKLRTIYETAVLLVPRFCFVCGLQTRESQWGIPMHKSEKCIEDWKFDNYRSHDEFLRQTRAAHERGALRQFEILEAKLAEARLKADSK